MTSFELLAESCGRPSLTTSKKSSRTSTEQSFKRCGPWKARKKCTRRFAKPRERISLTLFVMLVCQRTWAWEVETIPNAFYLTHVQLYINVIASMSVLVYVNRIISLLLDTWLCGHIVVYIQRGTHVYIHSRLHTSLHSVFSQLGHGCLASPRNYIWSRHRLDESR